MREINNEEKIVNTIYTVEVKKGLKFASSGKEGVTIW